MIKTGEALKTLEIKLQTWVSENVTAHIESSLLDVLKSGQLAGGKESLLRSSGTTRKSQKLRWNEKESPQVREEEGSERRRVWKRGRESSALSARVEGRYRHRTEDNSTTDSPI